MRRTLAVVAAVVATVTMTGCDKLSDDTKDKGTEAVCASQKSSIASMKAGGASARAAGAVIRDLTEDGTEINKVAAKVASNNSDKQARQKMVSLLKKRCG